MCFLEIARVDASIASFFLVQSCLAMLSIGMYYFIWTWDWSIIYTLSAMCVIYISELGLNFVKIIPGDLISTVSFEFFLLKFLIMSINWARCTNKVRLSSLQYLLYSSLFIYLLLFFCKRIISSLFYYENTRSN